MLWGPHHALSHAGELLDDMGQCGDTFPGHCLNFSGNNVWKIAFKVLNLDVEMEKK